MENGITIWNTIKEVINNEQITSFIENFPPKTIYICGGCVRNLLINEDLQIKDIDLFVNMSKEDFHSFISKLSKLGILEYGQYGSPRLFLNKGHESYIDIVPFFNFIVGSYKISTIEDLLLNFDFTANAIGIDVTTKKIINPIDGVKDINLKILKAVRLDFPEKNISKQITLSTISAFWFRLLHYQKKLHFTFSKETLDWIIENKYRYKDLETFKKHFFNPDIDENILTKILQNDK